MKKYAPEHQEVGVQVSLDLFGGEVIAVRSAPALNFSLSPIKPRETPVDFCGVCGKPEFDKDGVFRSFSRFGWCHICRATPRWHYKTQSERYERDWNFEMKRLRDKRDRDHWLD